MDAQLVHTVTVLFFLMTFKKFKFRKLKEESKSRGLWLGLQLGLWGGPLQVLIGPGVVLSSFHISNSHKMARNSHFAVLCKNSPLLLSSFLPYLTQSSNVFDHLQQSLPVFLLVIFCKLFNFQNKNQFVFILFRLILSWTDMKVSKQLRISKILVLLFTTSLRNQHILPYFSYFVHGQDLQMLCYLTLISPILIQI